MKKFLYLSLVTLCLTQSSCTLMVKGLAKLVVKEYNDHTDIKLSDLEITDAEGKTQLLSEAFKGKTVYLYLWKNESSTPPDENSKDYKELKQRFAKYPDVVFANLYIGTSTSVKSYKVVDNDYSKQILSVLSLQNAAPFIIGKEGSVLSYKGPKPSDRTLVDYVLFEANKGENGTKSAKKLIRGVNGKQKFKSQELITWYTHHFEKAPDESLHFGVSTTK